MNLVNVTLKDLQIVKDLAYTIWPTAYAKILCDEQLKYMLEKFYSLDALEKQITDRNHVFILAYENNMPKGFASYELNCENDKKAKLHKIYTLPESNGIGKLLLYEIEKKVKEANSDSLFLNVNRYNSAIDFYKKYGFEITKEEKINIGNNFIMDDYIMEKKL